MEVLSLNAHSVISTWISFRNKPFFLWVMLLHDSRANHVADPPLFFEVDDGLTSNLVGNDILYDSKYHVFGRGTTMYELTWFVSLRHVEVIKVFPFL